MQNKKATRIQFGKAPKSQDILAKIKQLRDEWAARNPERAHKLYPDIYPAPPTATKDETKTPG